MTPPADSARGKVRKRSKCPRCKGAGFKMLAHGPMVMDGQGVPAGVSRYDCRTCNGTGFIRPRRQAKRKGK